MRSYRFLSLVVLCFVFTGAPAFAAPKLQQLAVESDGFTLALWAREVPRPRGAIVLVHGRTWSSLPDFDLQVQGPRNGDSRSVMQSLNARGYSAFALDLRGYGKTPRDATGWLTPDQAARDVNAALEWLARDRHVTRPTLLGWSNGAIVVQLAAQRRPELISNLILFGYPRDPANPAPPQTLPAEPARAVNTREAAISDFITPQVTPQAVVEAFAAAALAADPVRADWRNPEQFAALDPARVVTPTLVLHGERDPFAPITAQARLFTGLGTADRRWVILPGADHAALIEDSHAAFIAAIVGFVERPHY